MQINRIIKSRIFASNSTIMSSCKCFPKSFKSQWPRIIFVIILFLSQVMITIVFITQESSEPEDPQVFTVSLILINYGKRFRVIRHLKRLNTDF